MRLRIKDLKIVIKANSTGLLFQFDFYKSLISTAFRIISGKDNELITAENLRSVAERLGLKMSKDEAIDLVNLVDEDANGQICLQEFQRLMCDEVSIEDLKREIRETFNVFDKDNNGTITCHELGKLIREFDGDLSEKETKEMIVVADINASGAIEIDELVKLLIDKNEDEEQINFLD
ncbi:hypothetical protein ACOME3_000349 [Neoechinorhynchus agilis]